MSHHGARHGSVPEGAEMKTIHIRVDEETYVRIKAAADRDERSVSNWAGVMMRRALRVSETEQ